MTRPRRTSSDADTDADADADPDPAARRLEIQPQPDATTCGPTCLDAVYRYYGDDIGLDRVIAETGRLEAGGTLAVFLACHALGRGYRATIYTYNLRVFDPTWFADGGASLREKLARQRKRKREAKLRLATDAYLDFLERGGRILFEDLTPSLLARYFDRSKPVLAGLSATYLYRTARELDDRYDDVGGEASGHFIVLCGYDGEGHDVRVADPYPTNPESKHYYTVTMHRLIGAIYLGILTYDANLLVIEPGRE
jgi:hypothetical protein